MSALLQRDAVRLSLGGGASPRAVTGGDGGAMAAVLKALETAEVAGQDRDHLARTLGAARVEAFKAALKIDVEGSREEEGCLRFDLLQDNDDPNKFVFYEVYKDQAAADFHKVTARCRRRRHRRHRRRRYRHCHHRDDHYYRTYLPLIRDIPQDHCSLCGVG